VVYPFIYCLAHTGARREEVRLLKWEHINFETGYITFKNTKSGYDRSIKMGLSLSTFLQALPRTDEFVFISQFGWLLSREQIDDTIVAVQKKNPGMKPWRCHDLRHSFAFNFLKRGGDMYALKAILGHQSIRLTIDLYGNFTAEHVKNVSPYDR
jgi:integrase